MTVSTPIASRRSREVIGDSGHSPLTPVQIPPADRSDPRTGTRLHSPRLERLMTEEEAAVRIEREHQRELEERARLAMAD